jgi:hypothetical protein
MRVGLCVLVFSSATYIVGLVGVFVSVGALTPRVTEDLPTSCVPRTARLQILTDISEGSGPAIIEPQTSDSRYRSPTNWTVGLRLRKLLCTSLVLYSSARTAFILIHLTISLELMYIIVVVVATPIPPRTRG